MFLFALLSLTAAIVVSAPKNTQIASLKAPSTCQLCEAVAYAAHVYADLNGLNATALEGQVANVCGFVPMQYKAECTVMVASFGLVECQCLTMPSAQFNATACCQDIALCANDNFAANVGAKPDQCDVCESVATTANIIAQYEGWNATVLNSKIGLVCGLVPMQYQAECKTLVATFGQIECQCITDPMFDAKTCCVDVGVCNGVNNNNNNNNNNIVAAVRKSLAVQDDTYCSACKVVATAVHYIAAAGGISGKQLDDDLTAVCNYVPSEYQAECQSVIAVGAGELSNCVTNSTMFDAQHCCFEASLCASTSAVRRLML